MSLLDFDIKMQLIIAFIIMSSIVSVESKDFCEAFIANKHRINLMFRRVFERNTNSSEHNVVVSGLYWTVNYNDNTNELTLKDSSAKSAPLFSSDGLIGAVCLSLESSSNFETFLFDKLKPNTVEHIAIANDKLNPIEMSFDTNKTMTITGFPPDLKPDIVFANPTVDRKVVDIVTRNGDRLSFSRLKFMGTVSTGLVVRSQPVESPWDRFQTKYQVMAISSQYSGSKSGEGFLVLLRDESNVLWCWVKVRQNCEPKTFQNCGIAEIGSTFNYTLVIICFVIGLIIGAAIVVFCLYYGRTKKEAIEEKKIEKVEKVNTNPITFTTSSATNSGSKDGTQPKKSDPLSKLAASSPTSSKVPMTQPTPPLSEAKSSSKTGSKIDSQLSNPKSHDSLTGETQTPKVVSNKGYTMGKMIGSGQFSKVYLVTDKNGQTLACKRFDLTLKEQQFWRDKCLKQEMNLMIKLNKLNNPHLVKTIEAIKTRKSAFIFMQFARNGSISDYLEKRGPIPERQAQEWFRQIADAIDFLHKYGVAHRDLKPDNFLLDDNYQKVLVTDFGFSAISINQEMAEKIMKGTGCGTNPYKSPELLTLKPGVAYDAKKVDMFALGVSLFEMLHNYKPFPEAMFENKTSLTTYIKLIESKRVPFNEKFKLSAEAKDCIQRLLEPNPEQRISAPDLMKHLWIKL